jgi:2-dehydropantoate 2-reductase
MDTQKMRVAVMGTGAVGGYFGGRLAAAGENVSFIARGSHLEALRREGLRIKSPQGDLNIRALFTSDPGEVGVVDLVLFCVKSYDTEDAAAKLAPMIGEKTVILSLQNGVDNPDGIATRWGAARTLAGVVYLGAFVSGPGTVRHSAGGSIVMGALPGAEIAPAKRVEEILSRAQIPCAISSEVRKVMWTKLVWNAPFCALACLARATVKEILEAESLRKLAADSMEEVIEAARSSGVELAPSVIEETFKFSLGLGDFKPSMLQDLEAQKPLEYEALNGIIVALLGKIGKKAPINQTCCEVLKFLDDRIRAAKRRVS